MAVLGLLGVLYVGEGVNRVAFGIVAISGAVLAVVQGVALRRG